MVFVVTPMFHAPGTERVTTDNPAYAKTLQAVFGSRCIPGADPVVLAEECNLDLDPGFGQQSVRMTAQDFPFTRHVALYKVTPSVSSDWSGVKDGFLVYVVADIYDDVHFSPEYHLIMAHAGISLNLEATAPPATRPAELDDFVSALRPRLVDLTNLRIRVLPAVH